MSFGVSLPFYKIVTKTVTVTESGATTSSNQLFNTNVPFGKAMNLRVIRPVIATKVQDSGLASAIDQVIWELTEDSTKTVVSQTDPFALATGGREYLSVFGTGVGFTININDLFHDQQSFVPPHPGIPTVAQQMNTVVTAIRVSGAQVLSFDVFLELYYELIDLSENLRTFLSNRIALQRTT
jgi:hypothetical protein